MNDKFLDRSSEFSQLDTLLATAGLTDAPQLQDTAVMDDQGMLAEANDAEPVIRNMDLRLVGLRTFLPDNFQSLSVSACKEICNGAVSDGEIYTVNVNPSIAAHISTSDIMASGRYSRFGWKFSPFELNNSKRFIRHSGYIGPVFKRILYCPECGFENEYTHQEIKILRSQTKSIFLECGVCKEAGKAVQMQVRPYQQRLSQTDSHILQFLSIEMRKAAANNENILPRVYAVYLKSDAPQIQWAPSDQEEEALYKKAEDRGRVIAPLNLCAQSGKLIEDIKITAKPFLAGWLYKRELFREFCTEKYGWARGFKVIRFSKYTKMQAEEEL